MRDPMSTAAQARFLLNVLVDRWRWRGHVGNAKAACNLERGLERLGWFGGLPSAITLAGRAALARYLLRTFTGPVEVVEEQPIMFAEEALVMLEVVAGRDVGMPATMFRDWIRRSRGKLVATTAGREALVSYLLRDFHA